MRPAPPLLSRFSLSMALFFSALLVSITVSITVLISTRFSFEPLYVPPVRGEGILQGLKVGEEKGVWVLDGWTGQVRFCQVQDIAQEAVCSPWQEWNLRLPLTAWETGEEALPSH